MRDYEQVIVIGYGTVTGEVLSTVSEYAMEYGYQVAYIEHEAHPFNMAKKYATDNGIEYHCLEKKPILTDYFLKKTAEKETLIVSAGNHYLFPAELVQRKHVTIINFHNALLPDLPGRNAPSWAIYKGYRKTGITWHYVAIGVDEGDIIIQKECEISDDIKAYELVAKQMNLASEAFAQIYEDVLRHHAPSKKQEITSERRIYKSQEVPGNGHFELNDDPAYIYRLLRSLDYGKNNIFPMATTTYRDSVIQIRRYQKIPKEQCANGPDRIFLDLDHAHCLMLKYKVTKDHPEV